MGVVETEASLFYLLDSQATEELWSKTEQSNPSANALYELENGWEIRCSEVGDVSITAESVSLEGVFLITIGPMQSSSLLYIRFSFDNPEADISLEEAQPLVTACEEAEDLLRGGRSLEDTNTEPIIIFSCAYCTTNRFARSGRLGRTNLASILSEISDDEQYDALRQKRQVSILNPDSEQLSVTEFPSSRSSELNIGTVLYCRLDVESCRDVFEPRVNKETLWVAITCLYTSKIGYWDSSVGNYRESLQDLTKTYSFVENGGVPSRTDIGSAISSKTEFYDDYRNIRDDCYIANELGDCLEKSLCLMEIDSERNNLAIQPITEFSESADNIKKASSQTEDQFEKLKGEYDVFAEQLAQDSDLLFSIESRDLQRSVRALTVATVLIGGANLFASELANGSSMIMDSISGNSAISNSLSWLATNPQRDVTITLLYFGVCISLTIFIYGSGIRDRLSQLCDCLSDELSQLRED